MLPDLASMKKRRMLLGMTQKELAKHIGISQSFIAKMESGKINPSYSHAKKVLDFLESLESRSRDEFRARQFYHKKVLYLDVSDRVPVAVNIMRRHNVSQLPVFWGRRVVGSVTEKGIVDLVSRGYDSSKISRIRVSDMMEDPFPIINGDMPLSVISSLLQHKPAVLISKEGEIAGIITKADIIKVIR
jgi:predicted transcriptional regulator